MMVFLALNLLKSVRPDQNDDDAYDGESTEDYTSQVLI